MNNTATIQKIGTKTSSFGTCGRINHDSTAFYDSKLYKELSIVKEVPRNENIFPKYLLNKLINSSSENSLSSLLNPTEVLHSLFFLTSARPIKAPPKMTVSLLVSKGTLVLSCNFKSITLGSKIFSNSS